jgi:capsid protein
MGRSRTKGKASRTSDRNFGYEAVENSRNRKQTFSPLSSEDRVLPQGQRSVATAKTRDLNRNFTLLGWMVRRHLDYVTQFTFHSRTKDKGFDKELDLWYANWCRPANCDVSGRFSFDELMRLAECLAVMDGDCAAVKLDSNQIQIVEGDRIRNPELSRSTLPSADGSRWESGIKITPYGRMQALAVHNRPNGGVGYTFDRILPAQNVLHYAKRERYDQVRGVSPILCSLNGLQDLKENFDYALARAKLQQLFAMVVTSNLETSLGDGDQGPVAPRDYSRVNVMNPGVLQMNPGDDAKFLESGNPSSQLQDYFQLMSAVCIKALDLPFSFYDESFTNFYGSRAAFIQYERATRSKRANLKEFAKRLFLWRLSNAIVASEITLPSGMTLATLPFEFVSQGTPWFDPLKEVTGELKAIGGGLTSPQTICKERGSADFYEIVDQIAEAQQYAQQQNVVLSFDTGMINIIENGGVDSNAQN